MSKPRKRKPRRGRPPTPAADRRSERVVLRATPAERAMLAAWAEREGRPLAELVLGAALDRAALYSGTLPAALDLATAEPVDLGAYPAATEALTADEVRVLLAEGRECRANLERRIEKMQRPADWRERAR